MTVTKIKKDKKHKKVCHKQLSEAISLDNKTKYLEKNKINIDSLEKIMKDW